MKHSPSARIARAGGRSASTASRQVRILTGVTDPAVPAVCGYLTGKCPTPVSVILTQSHEEAEQWAEDIEFFSRLRGNETCLETAVLPDLPAIESEDQRFFESECDRLATLSRLKDFRDHPPPAQQLVVLTTPRGFFHPVPAFDTLVAGEIRLQTGLTYSFRQLLDELAGDLRYDSEALCETPGQFAVRGGLIDVYPVNANEPYRIDFFGDEIEEIRTFDPTSQRSYGTVEALTLVPVPFGRSQRREHHIISYLGNSITWIFREPANLQREYPSFFSPTGTSPSEFPSFNYLFSLREALPDHWFGLLDFDTEDPLFGRTAERKACFTESLGAYRTFALEGAIGMDRLQAEEEARTAFLDQIKDWGKEGFAILCVCRNEGEENRLRKILNNNDELASLQPRFPRGSLREGFRIIFKDPEEPAFWSMEKDRKGIVFLSNSEIFGRGRVRLIGKRKRKLPSRSQVDQLLDFSELVEGDPLVHLQHGICLYRGLTRMEIRGKKEEVISLEFDEGITLHLPLNESHLISRYVGLTKTRPKLGRLGTRTWNKTRHAAEKATLDLAADLLNLQARRNLSVGYASGPDTDWQIEFEQSFIHTETPDQITAIEDTKRDLELKRPMERLICGDVGFGKTEVALRAAFKVVMDGRQVAVLVPTTILAQQHWITFRERVADYPVSVEMISRFRTRKQQKEILSQLRKGQIDIVIGTHRLLSPDINFKDLGLIVIDEEHRFGVRHKEKLKRLKEHIDVLAMSATPIPRTLYMALMGARDLSVIETPPVDRLPIQTIVKSYDLDLVKKSIAYEVARGGQVFYLHNRVDSIASVAQRLREILPGLKIAVGHGQMEERNLEEIMIRFVAGEFDVLVCTTIIESGLDIPNCNTIIIEGADRFGLSQLYQLRGRVGRFKRQAYAYLLLHRHTHLIDQARKRLHALRQYNQLGAGFKIATRDLELRGAGNLLGARQSGHIAGVGFELYCRLLRQSIARLKGVRGAALIRAGLRLDFVVLGEGGKRLPENAPPGFSALKEAELEGSRIGVTEAFIPSAYIGETRLRIDFYRQLAMAADREDVHDLASAFEDRFGPVPEPVKALLLVTEIRVLAEEKGIDLVETEGNRLKCRKSAPRKDVFIKRDNRFPRLTANRPLLRLKEIRTFLDETMSQ